MGWIAIVFGPSVALGGQGVGNTLHQLCLGMDQGGIVLG